MPSGAEQVSVLRVVVREGFSRDLASLFLADLGDAVARLTAYPPAHSRPAAPGFAHGAAR